MSIPLTGAEGLFTRLGILFFALRSNNAYLGDGDLSAGGLKAAGDSVLEILDQFQSTQQQVPNTPQALYSELDNLRSASGQWKNALVTRCINTLVEMVHDDVPLPQKTVDLAIKELIRQMIGAGTIYNPDNDVDASTVSGSVSASSSNIGTGTFMVSVMRPDGRPNEQVFNETVSVEITQAAGTNGTARQETAQLRTEASVTALAYNWPGGSGVQLTRNMVDATQDASTNMLANSSFNTFSTTNQPDYWGSPLVGVYGTDILEESTTVLRAGTKCLKFLGTGGGPLSSIAQAFAASSLSATASGTTATLKPNAMYAICFWLRKTASLAAGAFQIRLLDASNALVPDDSAGGSTNTITVAHGDVSSAAFGAFGGYIITPKTTLSTSAWKLNARVSTALTSGEGLFLADLAMVEITQPLYTGGPYVCGFAGGTNFVKGDRLTLTFSNNYAGAFQQEFDRVFGLKQLGHQLPSDTGGTETINDNLIA